MRTSGALGNVLPQKSMFNVSPCWSRCSELPHYSELETGLAVDGTDVAFKVRCYGE